VFLPPLACRLRGGVGLCRSEGRQQEEGRQHSTHGQ
jgi:hypothetical protein